MKSGYNSLIDIAGKEKDLKYKDEWNCLWQIHAPPKAKHLLWRICSSCLPTRSRLQARCVNCSLICPLCDHYNEDDWHILFTCKDSKSARQVLSLENVISVCETQCSTIKELILQVCREEDRDTAGLLAVLLGVLWNNRNNCVWNGLRDEGRCLGFKARQVCEEWKAVQHHQQDSSHHAQQIQQVQWQKPSYGWYKCNVDAGFHRDINKTSAGWVLRDHMGQLVLAGTLWNHGHCSIIEGEAKALLEALQQIEQRGITHVIFETDSKSVVDAVNSFIGGNSEFGALICNIRNIVS
ncbi:uncharacterized protein LOC123892151 [Trifolium pratense]|uniref:uncharacterized protein LOC123892151 n=1 Tax=Trifolium pratense TaxID=57577 RepID=UPI001E69203A|nr:uncharacterized protein LOC123892151 [Trifolium pratense]